VTRAVFLTCVTLLCLPATPAQAKSRKPLVGFGEQSQWLFSDERWFTLENNHRHYVRRGVIRQRVEQWQIGRRVRDEGAQPRRPLADRAPRRPGA
jgi:hypothetical protein